MTARRTVKTTLARLRSARGELQRLPEDGGDADWSTQWWEGLLTEAIECIEALFSRRAAHAPSVPPGEPVPLEDDIHTPEESGPPMDPLEGF